MQVGDIVQGCRFTDNGDDEIVIGAYMFRTNDPEEYIQDIVVRTADGQTVYLDEQTVRLYDPKSLKA